MRILKYDRIFSKEALHRKLIAEISSRFDKYSSQKQKANVDDISNYELKVEYFQYHKIICNGHLKVKWSAKKDVKYVTGYDVETREKFGGGIAVDITAKTESATLKESGEDYQNFYDYEADFFTRLGGKEIEYDANGWWGTLSENLVPLDDTSEVSYLHINNSLIRTFEKCVYGNDVSVPYGYQKTNKETVDVNITSYDENSYEIIVFPTYILRYRCGGEKYDFKFSPMGELCEGVNDFPIELDDGIKEEFTKMKTDLGKNKKKVNKLFRISFIASAISILLLIVIGLSLGDNMDRLGRQGGEMFGSVMGFCCLAFIIGYPMSIIRRIKANKAFKETAEKYEKVKNKRMKSYEMNEVKHLLERREVYPDSFFSSEFWSKVIIFAAIVMFAGDILLFVLNL